MILFFYKPYSRLGNRLYRYSHLASWCWENNLKFWDPTLSDYAWLFPAFQGDPLFSSNIQANRTGAALGTRKIVRYLITNIANRSLLPQLNDEPRVGRYFDLNGEEGKAWLNTNHTYPFIGINGFWFTSGELRKKYQDRLRHIFWPSEQILDQINHNLSSADPKKVWIGIHIRRTDYQSSWNGNAYYEWDEYRGLMVRLMDKIGPEKVQFLVCSDESIPENLVTGLPVLHGLGSINDIFTLSFCDIIIGPSSTFSHWSSFIGNRSLIELWGHPMWNEVQEEVLDKFLSSLNINMLIRNPFEVSKIHV